MKTALLHYWLTNMRGGENVLLEFCKMFPQADIFTHACNPPMVDAGFQKHKITETFIASLPGARKNCQKYLPLMPSALKKLQLQDYDFLLSSESGPAKGVRKNPDAFHVCYCHTPMRYLWDMYDEYWKNGSLPAKAAMTIFKHPLRKYDLKSAECVSLFIANSNFVAQRIKRIYGRDSVVVHPPVDTDYFCDVPAGVPKGGYYLLAGALIKYKRPDLAVQACMKMKRKIVVSGGGEMLKYLQGIADENVIFAGQPPKDELRKLYAGADALLFPGCEDFGIVPLEAQATGTPVIAYGEGGALETVKAGCSGIFFKEQSVEALCNAIEEFEAMSFDPAPIMEHARTFSNAAFRAKMLNVLKSNAPAALRASFDAVDIG